MLHASPEPDDCPRPRLRATDLTQAQEHALIQLASIHVQTLHEYDENDSSITIYDAQPAPSACRELLKIKPDEVVVKSRDSKGHSSVVRFRIPQNYESAIAAIIDKLACYRSREDFFRDAIYHRLAYLYSHVDPIARTEISALLLAANADSYEEKLRNAESAFERVCSNFRSSVKCKDYDSAQKVIDGAAGELSTLHCSIQTRLAKKLTSYQMKLRGLVAGDGTR